MRKPARQAWLSIIAIVVSLSGWGGLCVEYTNRQDVVKEATKAHFADQIDGRIDKKLVPITSELHEKTDVASVTHQIDMLRAEQHNSVQSIHDEMEKSNSVIGGTKEDVAKLSGKLDALEKDVNLLLQRQLRSAADLPNDALASQLPNVAFLYGMADQRGISICIETSKLIRGKLGAIRPSGQAYWSVAATTISQESAALTGGVAVHGTVPNLGIIRNTFRRRRVLLDGAYLAGNVFIECIVEYHGGATEATSNIFKDCLFVVSLSGAPPPQGQKIIQSLLASDLRFVQIG